MQRGTRITGPVIALICIKLISKLCLSYMLCNTNTATTNTVPPLPVLQHTSSCYAIKYDILIKLNPLNSELNPICYLLALLGAHHFLRVSRIRVKSLTLRLLMSYIYEAPILDVSRSHTMQHSR